jgi:hypothetical protein
MCEQEAMTNRRVFAQAKLLGEVIEPATLLREIGQKKRGFTFLNMPAPSLCVGDI